MKNGTPCHSSAWPSWWGAWRETVPGCCVCVWFFHMLLRLLFDKWTKWNVQLPTWIVSSDFNRSIKKKQANSRISSGKEDSPSFSWSQHKALVLSSNYIFLTIVAPFMGKKQTFLMCKSYCKKAVLQQKHYQPNTHFLNMLSQRKKGKHACVRQTLPAQSYSMA